MACRGSLGIHPQAKQIELVLRAWQVDLNRENTLIISVVVNEKKITNGGNLASASANWV